MKKILVLFVVLTTYFAAYSQIYINEYCSAVDTIAYEGHVCDWVELYNSGSDAVNLKGYGISDKSNKPFKYVIDCDSWLNPYSYKVILCNEIGIGLNTNFKLSSSGGEDLVLTDPSGEIVDKVSTVKMNDDFSYGRIADGSVEWGLFDVATPGERNGKVLAFTDTPVISPSAGFYNQPTTISIKCDNPSATIYFTTDGSLPTLSSTKYTYPFVVSANTAVRAVAIAEGCKTSIAATSTYFIKSRKISLPVVSLVTDNDNFFSDTKGIYVAGVNGVAGNCQTEPKNWNQDWERPVHIEYFDKEQKLQISQDAGVKITGSCSRGNAMKSLRVIARKEYGDNRLRYKFFDKKNISEFKSIVLRNGGNDFGFTMYRDGLVSGLVGEGMDVDVQAFQPAAVFLNGEYLGLHNIREKVSSHYLMENFGVDDDYVDILENQYMVNEGSNADYRNIITFINANSLADNNNYNKVAAKIDINNFVDYWIAQIYIDNEDWPNNNIKWWRSQGKNAKWRWIMFGAEFSCNIYGGTPDVNSLKRDIEEHSTGWGSRPWASLLIRKLLENQDFRNKFLQRFAYHIDHTFRYERVKEFSDSLKSLVQDEWPYHADRWRDWWYYGWDDRCNNMNEWFRQRPNYVREHLKNYFNISDIFDLTVIADCEGAKFSINGCPSTANVSGNYFSGVTLTISADLPSTLTIDHWQVTTLDGNETDIYTPELPLNLAASTVVKLYTRSADPVQYPNQETSVAGIYVNEVMTRNFGALADEYGKFPTWIEFYNSNDYDIDMAGLYIMNKKEEYRIPGGFPAQTTIPAKGYIVFFADGQPLLGPLHLGFTLKDDEKNGVYLGEIVAENANYLDWIEIPELKKNQSYGRDVDASTSLVTFSQSTPYDKNQNGKLLPQEKLYTSTKELSTISPVSSIIYPNPVSDVVHIATDASNVEYTLYTIAGQKIMQGYGNEVDISHIPSGIYVMYIKVDNINQYTKVVKR